MCSVLTATGFINEKTTMILSSSHQNYLTLLLLIIFFLGSCAKDEIIEESPRIVLPESSEIVETSLYGLVIDEAGQPVQDATVSYLSGTTPGQTTTDENGNFSFLNITNKGPAAFVSVRTPGKFEAFRKFSVVTNRFNYTEIKVLERKVIGTINSSTGGTLVHTQGASIRIGANTVIDGNSNPYNGDIHVAMAWIDPSAGDLSQRMVGDLSGIDEEGNYRSLSSYGMLQVELMDGSGNLLNLGDDQIAELKFPIPDEMLSQASSEIPLWSYEEVIGTWIQEGIAILQGQFYVGNVSHFSSWNVDHLDDPIEIKGQVKWNVGEGSVGGSYFQIYVCSDDIGRKGGWLCDDGSFRFYNFPKDEAFKLKVLDRCGSEIFKESYGPFSEDKNLGVIEVVTNEQIVKVSGNAVNCNGDPVTNGQLSVIQNEKVFEFPIDESGRFEFSMDFCDGSKAVLQVVDLDERLVKEVEVNPGTSVLIELNDLKICEELEEFISFDLDTFGTTLLTTNLYCFISAFQDSTGNIDVIKILHEGDDNSSKTGRFELVTPFIDAVPKTIPIISMYIILEDNEYFFGEDSDITVTYETAEFIDGGEVSGTFEGPNILGNFKLKKR